MDKNSSDILKKLNSLAKKANEGDEKATSELIALLKNSDMPKSVKRLLNKLKRQEKQKEIAKRHSRTSALGSVHTCLSGHTSPQTWRTTK